jgi:hypothetical protein
VAAVVGIITGLVTSLAAQWTRLFQHL